MRTFQDLGAGGNPADFYYSMEGGKSRIHTDDHIDSDAFDFIQSFADNIDEIRSNSPEKSEYCLQVISASFATMIHTSFRPISRTEDS